MHSARQMESSVLRVDRQPATEEGELGRLAGEPPGGGVLERGVMLKSRKPGDPHPFVDPVTFSKWVKRAQAEAAKAIEVEKKKAAR